MLLPFKIAEKMKSFILTITIVLSSLLLSLSSCAKPNDRSGNIKETVLAEKEKTLQKVKKRFQVMDQSLNIPMLSIMVPSGWTLHQDIASNPNGSGYLKFLLAMESPEGEVHGFLPLMMNYNASIIYGQQSGMYFDELVTYLMHYCSRPFLEKFTLERKESDKESLASDEGKQYREFAQNYTNMIIQAGIYASMDFDIIKMDFSAFRNNVPYKGMIKAVKIGVIDQNPYLTSKYGVIFGGYTLAPANFFSHAEKREFEMDMQVNPEWTTKRSNIIDMETQRMSQDHQARMAQQRQLFNAHQQNMASMRQTFDQQNQAWYERNYGSGGSSAYSGNTSVTDAITGYTSFSDPYSGHQIKKEGHYNYWYTNEFGEYHGTDDPNFKPGNHYSGNWKPIQPLKPNN